MKKNALILLVFFAALSAGCSKDDSDDGPLETATYELFEVGDSGVQGTVTISENEDGSATVDITLVGSTTDVHPAFIYSGNRTGNGAVAISLNACTCATSTTVVTQLDSGTKISYQGLKAFNGHVRIHESATDDTTVASGNIGVNAN